MKLLSKIRSFFVTKEEKSLSQFFEKYLRIRAEISLSDVKVSQNETNFKITWRGNVVPFWMSSEYKIEDAVSLTAIGLTLGFNLIEVSQSLKKPSNVV